MSSAMSDINASVFHMVNKPVLFINTTAELALKTTGKRFGLSNSFHTAVALNILNKQINSL